ncbi:MAG TPA: hypothetical protein VFY29_07020 [Terriglobia bacterium]|nr:hypothetical protein [Terriglobia bacterium]
MTGSGHGFNLRWNAGCNCRGMSNAGVIYHDFIDLKEQAAEIYLNMASRFSPEIPSFSALWLDMGMREKQHSELLRLCVAEGMIAPDLPAQEEMEAARDLVERLSRDAAVPDLSIEEAFRIAVELERSEFNGIYDRLSTPAHDSLYLFRRKVISLSSHLEEILKHARDLNVSDLAISELERLVDRHMSRDWPKAG